MRKTSVTFLLLALWGAFGFFMFTRTHEVAGPSATPEQDLASSGDAADAGPDAGADAAPETATVDTANPLGRPLRVAAAGWDLITPGLLANGGPAASDEGEFGSRGQQVDLHAVSSIDELERRMARGGADERGADIAIVSLPTFAARFEQLQALQPEIFFVSGWSRGRHAIYADSNDPVTHEKVKFVGGSGRPELFLTAVVAEAVGIDLSEVDVTSTLPPNRRQRDRVLYAIDRASNVAEDIRPILTTADATRAIPYVAFAQHGLLAEHGGTVSRFIAGWLSGVETLKSDVPAAARTVAAMPSSPDAVDLVRRLGQIEFADLRDNTTRFGLTGRDPVTLEQLFTDTWRVWRALGVLTTPRPTMPVDTAPITRLVLQAPPAAVDDGAAPSFDREPILQFAVEGRRPDVDALVAKLGWLAGAFPNAGIRVTSTRQGPASTRALTSRTATRYGFAERRFEEVQRRRSGIQISVIGAD